MPSAETDLLYTVEERNRFLQWLSFPEVWEKAFQRDYYQKSLRPLRISFLLGTILSILLTLRQYSGMGSSTFRHHGIGTVAMLLVLASTYVPAIFRYWQPLGVLLSGVLVGVNENNVAREIYLAQMRLHYPGITSEQHRMCVHLLYQISLLVVIFAIGRLQLRWFALLTLVNAGIGFLIVNTTLAVPTSIAANITGTFLAPIIIFLLMGAYFAERSIRSEFVANRLLEAEHERAERLLLNVLPGPIAVRLKQNSARIVDEYEKVTILFADIVNFTPLSVTMPAVEMVQLLDDVFSAFDVLAEQFNLEKIKTIGDAYMAAGGVPEPCASHLRDAVEMAFKMQEVIGTFQTTHGTPLQLRIGINTGSAIGGVIGTKKFIYDLWSDSVNVASRMESHGVPGQIQVTEEVYQQLATSFIFSEPQEITVKGRGLMRTYFLLGRQDPSFSP